MLKYLVKMKTVVVWLVMLVFTILGMQAQSYYYDELKEGSTLFDVGPGKNINLSFDESFVHVSKSNPYYFELTNGEPYIAIGANICWGDMFYMKRWMKLISMNGGNFARIWLSDSRFEIDEPQYKGPGWPNQQALDNIDSLLVWAKRFHLKLMFCVEDCRRIYANKDAGSNVKTLYHVDNGGPFNNMDEYINTDIGKQVYINRMNVFKEHFGDNPAILGWELWNEMDAIEPPYPSYTNWTKYMLPIVKKMFPKNLVMQSLGSYDKSSCERSYKEIITMEDNEVGQIHRYIDEHPTTLSICKGPMDLLAADAINTLKSYQVRKPLLLSETGAVQPKHAGPHEIYTIDTKGMLMHDMLFTPFFCGSAGSGFSWHWDNTYIEKNNLWYHIQRFANAVKDINPIIERFEPTQREGDGLRLYILSGSEHILIWCRDINNTWITELRDKIAPETLKGKKIDLSDLIGNRNIGNVELYDPWKDIQPKFSLSGNVVTLPDFQRSMVIRVSYK